MSARLAWVVLVCVGEAGCGKDDGASIGNLSRPPAAASPPDAGGTRIVLSGDAGKNLPEYLHGIVDRRDYRPELDPLLAELSGSLAAPDARMVWLGDNVYERGVSATGRKRAQRILDRQASVGSRVAFVPGNHDWDQSTRNRKRLAREEVGITRTNPPATPRAYHPGGYDAEALGPLTVVYLDSELAIEREAVRHDLLDRLGAIDPGAPVLVLSHHPLASAQKHGRTGWYDPLIDTELGHRNYAAWRTALGEWIGGRPGTVILGSGHDHGIQLLDATGLPGGEPLVQIVSGAGSKAAGPGPTDDTQLTIARPGFVVLDVHPTGITVQEVYLTYAPDAVAAQGPCTPMPSFPGWSACRPPARSIGLPTGGWQ